VEKIGVERARQAALASDAVIYVYDARAGWSLEDSAALATLDGKPVAVIANKIDTLLEPWAGTPIGARPLSGIASSAGETLGQVLADMVARDVSTDSSSETLSSLRQRDLVERARTATADALASLRRGDSPNTPPRTWTPPSTPWRTSPATTSEDVLRAIFSTFVWQVKRSR
jgi:tRNA U34 5-carboxymethylaminomethyl modifying GTPase MnmE/TrmE